MEKISLYRQSKTGIIEREDVLVVLGSERDQSVFDLIRKIGVKDLEGALKTLKKILESGDHPLLILTLLIRQYRLLWRAKELQERGITPREILKTLGVHPYYGQALLKQAGNYSEEQLQESFSLFKEVDSSLKENYHAPHLLLETLTLHLCQTAMPSTKKGHLF
jgi:DNA polymerase-3 subunit delta